MCFPSPGPRCSNHAHAEYLAAMRKFTHAKDPDEALRLGVLVEEKRRVFETTPRGLNMLRRDRDASQDAGERLALQKRFEDGTATRKQQLAAYNAMKQHGSRVVKDALREGGIEGRYQVAAGIAYTYLAERYPDRSVEIENFATIRLTGTSEEKVFVLPQKYQDFWGEAARVNGRWHAGGTAIEQVLNDQGSGLERLDVQSQTSLEEWFLGELSRRGYDHVLLVDTRDESAKLIKPVDLFQHASIGLTLREKRGGTTAWVGDEEQLREALKPTVFSQGRLMKVGRLYVVRGLGPQPRHLLHVGENIYLSWRAKHEDFVVKRTHQSTKSSLIVKLAHTGALTGMVAASGELSSTLA